MDWAYTGQVAHHSLESSPETAFGNLNMVSEFNLYVCIVVEHFTASLAMVPNCSRPIAETNDRPRTPLPLEWIHQRQPKARDFDLAIHSVAVELELSSIRRSQAVLSRRLRLGCLDTTAIASRA